MEYLSSGLRIAPAEYQQEWSLRYERQSATRRTGRRNHQGGRTLRVYSQLGVREYVAQMGQHLTGESGTVAARLLGATFSSGLAFYSGSGRVAIPERFMRMYGVVFR